MKKYVDNFKQACKVTGNDSNKLPEVSWMPEARAKSVSAHYQLDVIAEAQNKGCMPDGSDFVPDFSNPNQRKYFPVIWFNPSLGRFVYTYSNYSLTTTYLGARFYFPDYETAEYMGKKHIKLLADL